MIEQMPERDRLKLARTAEYVHRMTEECDRANRERQGLKLADGAALRATLSDRRLPTLSRVNALMTLRSGSSSDGRNSSRVGSCPASLRCELPGHCALLVMYRWDKPATLENKPMTVRELKERLAGAKDEGEVQIMVIGDAGPVATHSVDHIGLRDPESHSYGPMPEVVIVSGVIPPDTALGPSPLNSPQFPLDPSP